LQTNPTGIPLLKFGQRAATFPPSFRSGVSLAALEGRPLSSKWGAYRDQICPPRLTVFLHARVRYGDRVSCREVHYLRSRRGTVDPGRPRPAPRRWLWCYMRAKRDAQTTRPIVPIKPITIPFVFGLPSANVPLGPARIMSATIFCNSDDQPQEPSHDFRNSIA
jgi:hypothetical protein